jgi:photosystem II stability/assembly factor-like uncharacterized protein
VTLPSPIVTTVLPADEEVGYIGKLVVHGNDVFATGGTYHKPVFASSSNGAAFVAHRTPSVSGLRDILVEGKRITAVGEYGYVAYTTSLGKQWRRLVADTNACLYAIERDAERRLWITGDDGLVLRSKPGGAGLAAVPSKLGGRVLGAYVDPDSTKPWVFGTDGELARWDGKKFVVVPVPALKTKQSLNEMMRLPTKTLVIAANGGAIMRSRDDGATWTKSPTHVRTMIEGITATRYGVLAVGEKATLLVSYDDARSFTSVETTMEGHLWTVTPAGDGVLIGGDMGRIYRITNAQLARMMAVAYTGHDDRLAALAHEVQAGTDGAEMVLEDALRERGLW